MERRSNKYFDKKILDCIYATLESEEADATIVERDTAKTPTNEPKPRPSSREFKFGNFVACEKCLQDIQKNKVLLPAINS